MMEQECFPEIYVYIYVVNIKTDRTKVIIKRKIKMGQMALKCEFVIMN